MHKCFSICFYSKILSVVSVQPSPNLWTNHACMNEFIMPAMRGTPLKPQTGAASAADSLPDRRSEACLRGVD